MSTKKAPKVRLQDIAEAVDVSISTVSRALSGDTKINPELREKVLAKAKELGKDLTPNNEELPFSSIGLLSYPDILSRIDENSFYNPIMKSIHEYLENYNIPMVTHFLDRGAINYETLQKFIDDHSGMAFLLFALDNQPLLQLMADQQHPAVIVNGYDLSMRISGVSPFNRGAGYNATQYFINQGHTHLLHITCLARASLKNRLLGFQEAFQENQLAFSPAQNVLEVEDFTFETAYEAMQNYIQAGKFKKITAVLGASDKIALGAMKAITEAGYRVPDEVSFIGFDNTFLGQVASPSLTSVDMAGKKVGEKAIETLIQCAKNPDHPALRIEVGTQIVSRNSVHRSSKSKTSKKAVASVGVN